LILNLEYLVKLLLVIWLIHTKEIKKLLNLKLKLKLKLKTQH